MTQVDFYILTSQSAEQRLDVVCRLADKAVQNRQALFIHTADADMSAALDSRLWTFRDESFVAHSVIDGAEQANASEPVVLAHAVEPDGSRPILINLAAEVPYFFSRFERTLEVINEAPDVRRDGRRRWAFYKDRGYPLRHHALSM
ncbi:MAG TPA: DNA polymerase III subunit chi [Gammaproteobacteria bacterium]|jgi:DNA polymerase-3 subunit chi|nr:DNA polymerase III subunit chi [Gammaproteobacteria bacterium]